MRAVDVNAKPSLRIFLIISVIMIVGGGVFGSGEEHFDRYG